MLITLKSPTVQSYKCEKIYKINLCDYNCIKNICTDKYVQSYNLSTLKCAHINLLQTCVKNLVWQIYLHIEDIFIFMTTYK